MSPSFVQPIPSFGIIDGIIPVTIQTKLLHLQPSLELRMPQTLESQATSIVTPTMNNDILRTKSNSIYDDTLRESIWLMMRTLTPRI